MIREHPSHRNNDLLVSLVKTGTWVAFVEKIVKIFENQEGFNLLAVYHESNIPLPFPLETIEPWDYLGTIMVRSGHCSICNPSLFSEGARDNGHYKEWLDSIARFERELNWIRSDDDYVSMAAIISDGVVVECRNGYFPVKISQDQDGLITHKGISF